jgi:MoaA/NifB/PqqE/SkfB family radical SAM enzyme
MKQDLPKYIELETSKKCNRKCSCCPNGGNIARETQELMGWDLFLSIITQLSKLDFTGWLALHNYNEPLLNPRLIQELETINTLLPHSSTCIFSNGDFLTEEKLQELNGVKLENLRITLYPSSDRKEEVSDYRMIKRWLRIKKLNNLNWKYKIVRQGEEAYVHFDGTEIEIISPDLTTYNYRGDTSNAVLLEERSTPCYMTIHSSAIDYKGNMKMCCNVYPHEEDHQEYILGNLAKISFEDIWNSRKLNELRLRHIKTDWSISGICKKCNHHLPENQIVQYQKVD